MGDQCIILSIQNLLQDSTHRKLVGYQIGLVTLLLRTSLYRAQLKTHRNKPAAPKELSALNIYVLFCFLKCERSDLVNILGVCGQG